MTCARTRGSMMKFLPVAMATASMICGDVRVLEIGRNALRVRCLRGGRDVVRLARLLGQGQGTDSRCRQCDSQPARVRYLESRGAMGHYASFPVER